jgi:hypothetical protein
LLSTFASASALTVALALMAMADVGTPASRPEQVTKVAGGEAGDHQGAGVAVPDKATPIGRPLSPAEQAPAEADVVSLDEPEFIVEDEPVETTTTTVTALPSDPSTTAPTTTTTAPKAQNGGGGGVVAGGEDETPHKPHRPHTPHIAHCPRPPKPNKGNAGHDKSGKHKPEKAHKGDERSMKPVNGPKAQSVGDVQKGDRDRAQEKAEAKAKRDRERRKICADRAKKQAAAKAKKQAAKKAAKQARESDRPKLAARDSD